MISQSNLDMLDAIAAMMEENCPVSADLIRRLVAEVQQGGPLARMLSRHPDVNDPLFGTRALAGVRRLMLAGRAPALDAHLAGFLARGREPGYPERTWELVRAAALENPEPIAEALSRPVQQHTPSRAAMLVRGLGMVAAPEVRLLELGACAGLNLIPDKYRWIGRDWQWGDAGSAVSMMAAGPFPGRIEIVDRAGCDIHPLDVHDDADILTLQSFIPLEMEIAAMELADAIGVAAACDFTIDEAPAAEWLSDKLAYGDRNCHTVVWHSLFWDYLPPAEQDAVEEILASAARRMPLATVCFEPVHLGAPPRLQVRLY